MNPFWDTWRSRRNLNYFILSLLGIVALFIAGCIVHETGLDQYLVPVLVGLGLISVGWIIRCIRRARARRRARLKTSPLSRDELRVARSKLLNERKAKHAF